MAIKVGIISDPHGPLRPAVLEELQSYDYYTRQCVTVCMVHNKKDVTP